MGLFLAIFHWFQIVSVARPPNPWFIGFKLLNAMFGDSWLTELRNPEIARKTMDLEFKLSKPLIARKIDLAEELKIPVDKNIVGNESDQLNPAFFYSLRLIAFDDSELATNRFAVNVR